MENNSCIHLTNNQTLYLRNSFPKGAAKLKHIKIHEDHKGHESMHPEMFLILVFSIFGAQIALMLWKKYRPKLYHLCTLLGMWIFPMCYSTYNLYTRFMTVWLLFSLMTCVVVYISSSNRIAVYTPRRVYWWFLSVHKVSYSVFVGGHFLIVFSMLSPSLVSPSFALPFAGLVMFYGVYFGLITRDFAEFCTDKMAANISYFSDTGIPLRRIDPGVCALCTNFMCTDQGEKKYRLNCSHVFHEFCLRGWCIVGKKDTCPYCNGKVNLNKLIQNPWEKSHLFFGNFLDDIRYIIAWQPLIVMAVQMLTQLLNLK